MAVYCPHNYTVVPTTGSLVLAEQEINTFVKVFSSHCYLLQNWILLCDSVDGSLIFMNPTYQVSIFIESIIWFSSFKLGLILSQGPSICQPNPQNYCYFLHFQFNYVKSHRYTIKNNCDRLIIYMLGLISFLFVGFIYVVTVFS